MKNKYGIHWILAGVVISLLMPQFSAFAADKVVVIPLFSSSNEIPTVKSKTGRIWMDRNLGAIRVAGSISDSLAYGWLYQWGRPADGHESRTSPKTSENDLSNKNVPGHGNFIHVDASHNDWLSPQNNHLWEKESSANNPCPPGYRIPSIEEWQEEVESWDTQNAIGAMTSSLRLPMAGHRSGATGGGYGASWWGSYWASNPVGELASNLLFSGDGAQTSSIHSRANALSVRCISD